MRTIGAACMPYSHEIAQCSKSVHSAVEPEGWLRKQTKMKDLISVSTVVWLARPSHLIICVLRAGKG